MNSIKKNFAYSSILTLSGYIFPLLTFPYVTRVLGVENIGIFNFVESTICYFTLFSTLGIGTVGVREIAKNRKNKETLSSCFSNLLIFNVIATIVVEIVLLTCIFFVPKFYAHKEMMLMGALQLFSNVFLVEWFYKGLEEFKYITVRSIIVKALYVVSVFLFVKEPSDYRLYYYLLVLMYVINAIVNWVYIRTFIECSIKKINLHIYSKTIFTMGIYAILTSMYTTFNVMFLGLVSSDAEVGYYTTATKLYKIIMAFFTAFTGVMLPRMSFLVSENRLDDFKYLKEKSIKILCGCILPIVIFTEFFAPEIIQIIGGDGYDGAIMPMRITMPLMLIIGFEQILIIQTLLPLKKDKAVLFNSILGAAAGVSLNFLLVPHLGSIGSALTWITSEIIVLVAAQIEVTRFLEDKFPLKIIIQELSHTAPLILLFGVIAHVEWINSYVAFIIAGVAMSVYYLFYLRKYKR